MKHARNPRPHHTLITAFIALAIAGVLIGVVAAATVTGVVIDAHESESRHE
jgi:hypothetical protein